MNQLIDAEAKGSIHHQLSLSSGQEQLATGALILGCILGAISSSWLADRFGLRPCIVYNNGFFILGSALLAANPEIWSLLLGRFVCGLGVGLGCTLSPVLLADIAPPADRGRVTTGHQLALTIGILVSTLVGYIFVGQMGEGWRIVFGFIACLSVFQVILSPLIPESPRWLLSNRTGPNQNGLELARSTLILLRRAPGQSLNDPILAEAVDKVGGGASSLCFVCSSGHFPPFIPSSSPFPSLPSQEMEVLKQEQEDVLRIQIENDVSPEEGATWAQVWSFKNPMIIGLLLCFFQPMSGINSVMFYSSKIFGFAGVEDQLLSTLIVGIINVLMTVFAIFVVDLTGRRVLLLWGTVVATIGLTFQGIVLLTMNDYETTQGYLALIGCLVYIMGFAVGLGAMCWVVLKEVLPPHTVGKAYGVFILETWIWNFFISMFTLTWIENLGGGDEKEGAAILFLIFAGICFAAVVFMVTLLPETKKMPEHVMRWLWGDEFYDRTIGKNKEASALEESLKAGEASSAVAAGAADYDVIGDPAQEAAIETEAGDLHDAVSPGAAEVEQQPLPPPQQQQQQQQEGGMEAQQGQGEEGQRAELDQVQSPEPRVENDGVVVEGQLEQVVDAVVEDQQQQQLSGIDSTAAAAASPAVAAVGHNGQEAAVAPENGAGAAEVQPQQQQQ